MSHVPTGTVYGTLLNFRSEVAAWAPKMHDAPYNAPPIAPVLYIKPANTWSASGDHIALPARVLRVEVGATIGLVIGANGRAAGYVLMNDLSVPHDSLFRPPVKFKCLDGFLGIGPLVPADGTTDLATATLEVFINGELRQTVAFTRLVRDAARLLADVGEFMTLQAGDILMPGCDVLPGGGRPLARAGDHVEIASPGLGLLANLLVAETKGVQP